MTVERAIVLAAGESRRTMETAGVPKALLPYHGRPFLLHQLDALGHAGIREVIVVLGYHLERFYDAIAALRFALERPQTIEGVQVRVAVNEAPERGPFSSLQTALRLVEDDTFLLPVDVPCARAEVWQALQAEEAAAVVPAFEGRGGHPVLLRASAIDELLGVADGPDARLDVQLRRIGGTRVEVDDPTILENHNEASDYEE